MEDDENFVYVLEDEDLEIVDRNNEDIQSPLRSINIVLQEAQDLLTDGPMDKAPKSKSKILMDEVDVEFSPMTKVQPGQPIEVIVRHSKWTTKGEHDEEEQPEPQRESRSRHQRKPSKSMLGVLREETEEFYRRRDQEEGLGSSKQEPAQPISHTGSWKKGHRRAFSMPNAKGEKMTLAVIQDHKESDDGNLHSRKIVRYKLRAKQDDGPLTRAIYIADQKNTVYGTVAIQQPRKQQVVRFEEVGDDDEHPDHGLEVEINEEEITYPGDLSTGEGSRVVIKKFWEAKWKVQNFELLPVWLQDNEYLKTGHRPPMPSFSSCFKSIFAVHTETGNIWTHMYGCVAFIGVAIGFLCQSDLKVQFMEKLIFSAFFLGAVICMGMSFVFHTVQCHSDNVSKFFSKLDYTGITLLIVGSFIPWIYYGFYCRPQPMLVYITMITILGISAMVVSLWDKFAEPKFRPVRAGVFVAMGLSSIFPAIHFFITDGFWVMWREAALMWLLIMAFFYLSGAALYATRVPERFFPGHCDYWFQSHQLFHTFVVLAAFVHYYGMCEMAAQRLAMGSCSEQLLRRYGVEASPSWLGTLLHLDEPAGTISWTPESMKNV
ncbi:unnamed protein product, partial [Mesorhabditis spiculigera]